jgi:hypothetical protein
MVKSDGISSGTDVKYPGTFFISPATNYLQHVKIGPGHMASGIEMYLLRGVKTLTLVKNVSRDTLIEVCCVAGLCRVVMMSYFLDNDATSV